MNSVNEDEKMKWETLSSEYLFRRPWLTARRDVVRLPNGTVYDEYYVLEYPMWINVIAITPEGKFVMVKQYRHGLGIVATELCAGVAEKGEDPLATAQRELLEETGFGGGEWELSMVISANPSSQNNLSYSFIARDVERIAEQHLDETEDIRVELLSEDEVWDMLVNDNMKQALMAAPLWKYFALKGRQK
ncbi:NUDIX hydrolase [uncultured Duncaniella sp.]|uniref:NUDIX hydrolase n=1 Tax=uncultured Duncaniella sp. TaxID=2768039 RepID=UPI0025B2B2D3|nr:NUDIX hydrolase [uncultured Duncaniella sp.]